MIGKHLIPDSIRQQLSFLKAAVGERPLRVNFGGCPLQPFGLICQQAKV